MHRFSFRKYLRTLSAALSSLLMASGCHYDGRTGATPGYHSYDSNSSPPFFRSFPQNQPYDGSPQAPTPQEMPPSVLPTPGFSEPSESIPPSPTTQRTKRTLFPYGFRFAGFSRQGHDLNQATTRSAKPGQSQRTVKAGGSSTLPELSSTPSVMRPSDVNTKVSDESVRSISKQDDTEINQAPRLNTSEFRRPLVRRQRLGARATLEPQLTDADSPVETNQIPSNTDDAPSLLPPPL